MALYREDQGKNVTKFHSKHFQSILGSLPASFPHSRLWHVPIGFTPFQKGPPDNRRGTREGAEWVPQRSLSMMPTKTPCDYPREKIRSAVCCFSRSAMGAKILREPYPLKCQSLSK